MSSCIGRERDFLDCECGFLWCAPNLPERDRDSSRVNAASRSQNEDYGGTLWFCSVRYYRFQLPERNPIPPGTGLRPKAFPQNFT